MTAVRAPWFGVLAVLGMGWGLTQPLAKIAVSAGYPPFGIIFWQSLIISLLLGSILVARGQRLPYHPRALGVFIAIALSGTIIPNAFSYTAAFHLPSGIMSIAIATVPMFAFPIALALGADRFSLSRLVGLVLGICGVGAIVLPQGSLGDGVLSVWVFVALVAPLCYAIEGNYVAKWGTAGLDPVQTLFGASIAGILLSGVGSISTGQFFVPTAPFQTADLAIVLSSLVHGAVYTGYVWLVGRAGSVFAAQVSYIVTLSGVVWAMLILGESYSGWVWGALLLMIAGISLVQPRLNTKPELIDTPLPPANGLENNDR